MSNKLKAAGYVRVSTPGDSQEGSFEAQTAYLQDFLRRQPHLEPVGIFGDQGLSGRHMRNRPGLQQMIKAADDGQLQVIYCKSLSRLARNMRECLEILGHFQKLGIRLVFIKEGIDTALPENELILAILAAIAAAESDSIAENLRLAREKALLSGQVWHRPPYGYLCDKDKHWHINPKEALRINKLFALASQGIPYAMIRRELNIMEKNEATGRIWTQDRLLAALRNEAYTGDYLSHKKLLVTNLSGSKRRIKNTGQKEQFFLQEHHPPLVSREIFQRANELQRLGLLKRHAH